MRRFAALIFLVQAFAWPATLAFGARDGLPPQLSASPYELVVFEADGCVFCEMLRRDVLPLYTASEIQREAPIRFVNVSKSDETKMGLAAAITIAPTVVLMRDGQEVDRIIGYSGPFNFLQLVGHMMGRPD